MKVGERVKITVDGSPKEIADLVSNSKSAIKKDINVVIDPQAVWKAICDKNTTYAESNKGLIP